MPPDQYHIFTVTPEKRRAFYPGVVCVCVCVSNKTKSTPVADRALARGTPLLSSPPLTIECFLLLAKAFEWKIALLSLKRPIVSRFDRCSEMLSSSIPRTLYICVFCLFAKDEGSIYSLFVKTVHRVIELEISWRMKFFFLKTQFIFVIKVIFNVILAVCPDFLLCVCELLVAVSDQLDKYLVLQIGCRTYTVCKYFFAGPVQRNDILFSADQTRINIFIDIQIY